MKNASVADLRNHFQQVSKWIQEGESVSITKRGKPFATLSPDVRIPTEPKLDRMARLKELNPTGRRSTDSINALHEDRGAW